MPDRTRAAIRGMAFEFSLEVIRRDVGFADDPLQEAVVASVIGETADPPRFAHPIFRVPMRLDMDNSNHVIAGRILQIMVGQIVAAVVVLIRIIPTEPVNVCINDALRVVLRHDCSSRARLRGASR